MSADKLGVAVLGMSRSGTSAVTRMFAMAGFFAGTEDDLLEATEANPTGHWENRNVFHVNESILHRMGGTWFDPPEEAEQLAARPWATPELLAVFERIVEQAGDAPVALKDPRIGVMLPLWGGIIDHHLHPVLVIRDPIEIAMSVNRRDGSPTSFTLAAWQLHMAAVVRHVQRRVVTIAPYDQLLGSAELAERVVRGVAGHLRDDLAGVVELSCAPSALDPKLRRNDARPGDHEQQMSPRQLELWRALAALEAGEQWIEVPEDVLECGPAVRRAVRAETERNALCARVNQIEHAAAVEAHRGQVLAAELAAERERGRMAAAALAAELAGERERIVALSAELAGWRAKAETAQAGRTAAEGWLVATQASASWRLTAPLRAGKRAIRRLLVR